MRTDTIKFKAVRQQYPQKYRTLAYPIDTPAQRPYSMRFFKHIGLKPAWNMRAGAGAVKISK
ncbi:MAG: hypothetical protein NTY70_20750 [Burkholderiales bacterium]|nr:hypothetical protein [Burkholderiales bacterium]